MDLYLFTDSVPFNFMMTVIVEVSKVYVPSIAAISLMAHR